MPYIQRWNGICFWKKKKKKEWVVFRLIQDAAVYNTDVGRHMSLQSNATSVLIKLVSTGAPSESCPSGDAATRSQQGFRVTTRGRSGLWSPLPDSGSEYYYWLQSVLEHYILLWSLFFVISISIYLSQYCEKAPGTVTSKAFDKIMKLLFLFIYLHCSLVKDYTACGLKSFSEAVDLDWRDMISLSANECHCWYAEMEICIYIFYSSLLFPASLLPVIC